MGGQPIVVKHGPVPTRIIYDTTTRTVVINESGHKVWLGADGTVTPGNGVPLVPSSSAVWTSGQCWCVLDDQAVTDDVRLSLSTSTEGYDPGPAVLANAIIDAGLATDIANDLNAVGVPSIDNPAVLRTTTLVFDAGGLAFMTGIDISAYQSVEVQLFSVDTVEGKPIAVNASFGSASGANDCGSEGWVTQPWSLANPGPFAVLGFGRLPAIGRFLRLDFSGDVGRKLVVTVVGSYRPVSGVRVWEVSKPDTQANAGGTDGMLYEASAVAIPNNTSAVLWLPLSAGKTVQLDLSAGAGALTSNIGYGSATALLPGVGLPATTSVRQSLVMPRRPIVIKLTNTSGGASTYGVHAYTAPD